MRNRGTGRLQAGEGGGVRCWGANNAGQLGDGNAPNIAAAPVAVSSISTAVDLLVGQIHSCAVLADKTVRCWGSNGNGCLGNGGTGNSGTPVAVTGLVDAVSGDANGSHSCARKSDGTVACWGWNNDGQLGNIGNGKVPVSVVQ